MGWKRMTALGLAVGWSLFWAAPAGAQDDGEPAVTVIDDIDKAQPESQIVRDDDTSATVHGIRRNLLIIAAVTTAGLVVFIWHTNPSRRLTAATRRAAVFDAPESSPPN